MHLKRLFVLSLATALCLAVFLNASPAQSKRLVIDEGQAKLMQEINKGQKSKQLTPKEANKLRKDLSHVARQKAKELNKTNRKLTAEDSEKLKSDVSEIRDKMLNLEREKSIK